MVPIFDLTDRKSERSLAIVKNDATQRSSSALPAAIASMLHTNYLRKITAGSLASSVITHIFRKIVRIPLTMACTMLDERQVHVPERVRQTRPLGTFGLFPGSGLPVCAGPLNSNSDSTKTITWAPSSTIPPRSNSSANTGTCPASSIRAARRSIALSIDPTTTGYH